jgi:hypothetical protein
MRHNNVTMKLFHLFLIILFLMLMLDGICKIKLYIASFHALTEAQAKHILKINGE